MNVLSDQLGIIRDVHHHVLIVIEKKSLETFLGKISFGLGEIQIEFRLIHVYIFG